MKILKQFFAFTMLLLFCFTGALAQQDVQKQVEIKGIVKNDKKEPLVGVTVIAKGQPGLGTQTNSKGEFTIKIREFDILLFNYVGLVPFEIPVPKIEDKKNLQVILLEDNKKIDEVVITAAGKQKRQTVTGAFTTVDVKRLNAPTANLTNSLAGVVPGIIAVQSSGEPGENISEFWIRGVSTFGAKQSALVLVDGIERSFNEIPVEDIESFSVLKDASATAIYGQRGANGVVLITTKKGEKGRVKINAKTSFNINTLTNSPKYADVETYALMANEALRSRYESPLFGNEELSIIRNGLDNDLFPNVNWKELLLKDSAPSYNANLNFSGGGDNVIYYVSLGYYDENGIYRSKSAENKYNTSTSYRRYNYRTNVDINLTKSTIVKIGIGGWLANKTSPGSVSSDIWESFNRYTPLTYPRKYTTGQWPALTPEVLMTQTGYRVNWTNKMETNIGLDQNLNFITEGLRASGVFAFDMQNSNNITRSKSPELWRAQNYRDPNGDLILRKTNDATIMTQTSSNSGTKRYYMQAQMDYNRTIRENHNVGGLLMVYRQELTDTNLGDDIISSIPKRNLAYSGRFLYGYKEKYLAEFNWGYTGSENFEKGKQFGFFPAVSAGWVISEEKVVKTIAPWLNMLKVRASYGEVGSDEISGQRFPYITLVQASSAGYPFGEFGSNTPQGYRIRQIGTPYLTWEVAKKYNLGVDIAILANKVTATVDIFKDVRNDIFMKRNQMPLSTGLADQVPMANVGKMRSNGIDGNISYSDKVGEVSFTVRANVTYQNNEIIDKDEAANELWYRMEKGFRQNQTRGLIALGLFSDEEDINSSPTQTFGGKSVLPGDIKYKDVNGDGIINDDDVVPLGYRTVPGIQYGTGFSLNWKGFDFSVLFQGAGKRDFFVNGSGVFPFQDGAQGNVLELMATGDRWIAKEISGDPATENANAEWPRLTYGINDNNSRNSTFWLKNGSYLRLKNVEFSYNLPKSFTSKMNINRVRVGFVGQNLYTWSPFKWWDAESGRSNGANYPITKNYNLFLQVSF